MLKKWNENFSLPEVCAAEKLYSILEHPIYNWRYSLDKYENTWTGGGGFANRQPIKLYIPILITI